MRVDEAIEKSGYFWLPEKSMEKLPGLLRIYDGGQIEVEILGFFGGDLQELFSRENPKRVVGLVEGFGYVTLEDCWYLKKGISLVGGVEKSRLGAHFAYCGIAYEKDDEPKTNNFTFSVEGLDEWLGISGTKSNYRDSNGSINISYEPPEEISYILDDDIKLSITFEYNIRYGRNNIDFGFKQKAYFRLVSSVEKDTQFFTGLAHKISYFMSFAIDDTVSIREVSMDIDDLDSEENNNSRKYISIKIFYPSISFQKKAPKIGSQRFLLNFDSVREKFSFILTRWMSVYDVIIPSMWLYFGVKRGVYEHLDGKFLALCQGLETLHRRTMNKPLMDGPIFNKLVKNLMDGCPEEYRQWLEARLTHGNEISLSKRIKQLIEPFKHFFGNSDSRRVMVKKITDTRNYFTHYSEELKSKAVTGRELYYLSLKLEALYQLNFLKAIDIDMDTIQVLAMKCPQLKNKLEVNLGDE